MITENLHLGTLIKEYKRSSGHLVMVVVLSLISAGIAAIFFSAWFSNETLGTKIGLSIPGTLFLLPFFAGVYVLFRGRGASLALYENGLIYRRGSTETATLWDDIDSYIEENACRITKQNGEVIEFGLNIKGADEVAQKIQAETLRIMLPQVKTAISNGSSIQFAGVKLAENVPLGKAFDNFIRASSGFTVDAHGITDNDTKEQIAWRDITDYGVTEEEIGAGAGRYTIEVFVIERPDKCLRTRFGLLSNAHVLVALCDEMVTKKNA